VKKFANAFSSKELDVDMLILNAGIVTEEFILSTDGLETQVVINLVLVLLYMLYVPSHEYFFLIDFILYICRYGWFRISMEIDFVTHIL
jgi:hypothetical protein